MSGVEPYVKIWSKKHSLRLGENWSFSPLSFKNYFGITFPNQFIGYKNGIGYGFLNEKMLEACNRHFSTQIKEKGFDDFFEIEANKVFGFFLDYCKEVPQKIDKKISNDELSKVLIDYTKEEDVWMNFVWLVFLLDDTLTNEVEKMIQTAKLTTSDLDIVMRPKNKTAALESKIKILELAVKKNQGKNISVDLRRLAEKYGFFSILNMDEEPFGVEYFDREVSISMAGNPTLELKTILEEDLNYEREWEKVKSKYENDKELMHILEACRSVAYYREHRNDLRQECYFYARVIYLEIARRAEVDITLLVFATRRELQDFLVHGIALDTNALIQRKVSSAIVSDYTNSEIKYEFEQDKIVDLWPHDSHNVKSEIKGIPVSGHGIIEGKVKIIKDVVRDGKDFEEGSILVATTTNLTFTHLFNLSNAIVTDEGGLLTHAAIVARELKKPCIVGTQTATKLLKDGDQIKIDLTKGIIYKK